MCRWLSGQKRESYFKHANEFTALEHSSVIDVSALLTEKKKSLIFILKLSRLIKAKCP